MKNFTEYSAGDAAIETEETDWESENRHHSPPTPDLTDLEYSIISTIAYRDQFDWPMTAEEICDFLHGEIAGLSEVEEALGHKEFSEKYLVTDGRYYALNGRKSIIPIRYEREQHARKIWPKAKILAAVLATMPFVRMVGVTGSLAANNPYEPVDIDFLIIIENGKMWRVRALSRLLQLIDRKFIWRVLCVNYFLTPKALQLKDRRLYVAQELFQMVPLFGRKEYQAFILANDWALAFLPNAAKACHRHDISVKPFSTILKKILQFVSAWPFGDMLEQWEGTRKMRRYNETDFLEGKWSKFTWECCGHRLYIGDEIEDNWRRRLADLDLTVRGPQ